jgi:hypothetical protein
MRQPTFRSRRTRQQRLIRTGLGVVAIVGIIAILVGLLTGDETPEEQEPSSQVAFSTRANGTADSGARRVPDGRVRPEAEQITALLNDWYQGAFVDPSVFVVPEPGSEDATAFPPEDMLAHFTEEARATAAEDVDALTLGSERGTFEHVDPKRTRAQLSILFANGTDPTVATADVTFEATGTLREDGAAPVAIVQTATIHFTKGRGGWRISFYEAHQEQESISPSPSPEGS